MILRQWGECSPYINEIQSLDKQGFNQSAWDQSVWKGLFDNRNLVVVLVFNKKELAAFAVISFVADEAELLRIFVKENFRRKKIGSQLIADTITALKEERVSVFYLEVRKDNHAAIGFYINKGFKEVGERTDYYQNPSGDALVFSRSI